MMASFPLRWLALPILLATLGATWAPAASTDVVVHLGVINERPERPSEALELYGSLNAYLARRLAERNIHLGDLVIARNLDEMAQRIEAGDVDALLEGVMPTLSLQRRTHRIEPSLLAWRKGQRQYHTVFFVRQDSPVQDLQGLRGKTIAFESARSTSAYFVPRATLQAEGLKLSPAEQGRSAATQVRYLFAGSELNQAYWVQAGRADAGAFNDGDWERVPPSVRQELRIIDTTPAILRWLLSFSTSLAPQARNAMSEILVTMHRDSDGRAALSTAEHIAKLEPLTDEDRANLAYWSGVLLELD